MKTRIIPAMSSREEERDAEQEVEEQVDLRRDRRRLLGQQRELAHAAARPSRSRRSHQPIMPAMAASVSTPPARTTSSASRL
jgi:hypothetical protein